MSTPPPTTDDVDDWVHLAMKDDVAVVGVLLRMRHAVSPLLSQALKLEWRVRQRRSKHVAVSQSDDVIDVKMKNNKKKMKGEDSTGGSPTTPLSWSDATSFSGGEESRMRSKARSKVAVTSCCATISKRPRKRKTLAELREEECDLLKERRNLEKELQSLLLHVEKQRATNESLKKLKDKELEHSGGKLQQIKMKVATSSDPNEGIWSQPQQVNAASGLTQVSDLGTSQKPSQSSIPNMFHEGNCREAAFPLPDLNLSFEENHNIDVLS